MNDIYGLDAAGREIAASVTALAKEVVAPNAPDVDGKGRFPEESIHALGTRGLLGLCIPTSLGGKGQGPRTFVAVVEELAKACSSTAMVYVMHVTAAQAIAASTTLARRDDLLRDMATGKHLTTLALSEKGSRSNFWMPVSRMVPSGKGWETSAEKSFVTSAGRADSFVSSALDANAKTPVDSTCYLVRRGARGVSVEGRFNGLGLRGNESAPIVIDHVSVASGDLVSEPGAGIKTMLEVILPWFSIGTAAMSHGLCRAAIETTSAHLSGAGMTSASDGKKQFLRELPNLRSRLAMMSVRSEQARALLAYTIGLIEKPTAMTPLYVLQSRMAAIEAAVEVTDLAMKTCGGAAFSKHLPVERYFRDARAGWVMAPTTDHLQDFIGKALTGMPLL